MKLLESVWNEAQRKYKRTWLADNDSDITDWSSSLKLIDSLRTMTAISPRISTRTALRAA